MAQLFSAEQLKAFDGSKAPGAPIYLSVCGLVYDVTKGAEFYGPGQPYSVFAGKEVSRCLGKMEIDDKEANAGWANLNDEHKECLQQWEARFKQKYPCVGTFSKDGGFEARALLFEP